MTSRVEEDTHYLCILMLYCDLKIFRVQVFDAFPVFKHLAKQFLLQGTD